MKIRVSKVLTWVAAILITICTLYLLTLAVCVLRLYLWMEKIL